MSFYLLKYFFFFCDLSSAHNLWWVLIVIAQRPKNVYNHMVLQNKFGVCRTRIYVLWYFTGLVMYNYRPLNRNDTIIIFYDNNYYNLNNTYSYVSRRRAYARDDRPLLINVNVTRQLYTYYNILLYNNYYRTSVVKKSKFSYDFRRV